MEAAFKPEVKDELDTQNFEKFEEVRYPSYFIQPLNLHDIFLAYASLHVFVNS